MSEEKKEKIEIQTAQDKEVAPAKDFSSELNEPQWSVVSFEKCLAKGLTYDQAFQKMKQFKKKNHSGLCILTDEAAARIGLDRDA